MCTRQGRNRLRPYILILTFFCGFFSLSHAAPTPPAKIKFSRDILPLMQEDCVVCHSGSAAPGGYSQETAAKFLAGGRHGAAALPGKSKDSTLVKYLTGELKPQMPPGEPWPVDKIALVRRWIDEGAKIDSMVAAPLKPDVKPQIKPETKAPNSAPEIAQVAPVTALSYAPDGKTVAVGSFRAVHLLNPENGDLIRTLSGPGDQVLSLAWSSDGSRLAAAGGAPGGVGEVLLWTTDKWEAPKTIAAHGDSIFSLAWKPNSLHFATASLDKTVQVWDAQAGASLHLLKDHVDPVFAVAFSPDGQWMATGGGDRSLKLYKTDNYKRSVASISHNDAITALAFSPKGDLLIAACADKHVKVWPLKLDALANPLRNHHSGDVVNALAFSSDGNGFVWGASNRTVRFWNGDLTSHRQHSEQPEDWVYAVALSPDGKTVVAGAGNGAVYAWRANGDRPLGDKAAWTSKPGAPEIKTETKVEAKP
jgi:dipeptidyl aminopeptidase/acylaminoacyl peptidase